MNSHICATEKFVAFRVKAIIKIERNKNYELHAAQLWCTT